MAKKKKGLWWEQSVLPELWDKRAKCSLWAGMDAKESSRTWVAMKGPCPDSHPPEVGDSNRKNQDQSQPEVISLLPGTMLYGSLRNQKKSHLPLRGLKSHTTTTIIKKDLYSSFPSSPSPHPHLEKQAAQGGIEKAKTDHMSSFPTTDFWAWIRLGAIVWRWAENL